MAVGVSGKIVGAVSGGCVEGAVVELAWEVLDTRVPQLARYGYSDEEAWDVGLQCGGEIDVWVEPLASPDDADGRPSAALTYAFDDLSRRGEAGALVTVVSGSSIGLKVLVTGAGMTGSLGSASLDELIAERAREAIARGESELHEVVGDLAIFIDVTSPPPRVFVFGAVDYAASLCTAVKFLGWRPFVIDPRSRFAQRARFPDAEQVIAGWPDAAFAELGGIDEMTAIVVLTHDPKLDDAALDAALSAKPFYIGAMGSRGAQQARRERLLARGIQAADLERVCAPVGLDIGAVSAQETALSILSEIVAARRGRQGGPLANAAGRIHPVAGDVRV
jgi:xanthine dehydrogenase accessory factor